MTMKYSESHAGFYFLTPSIPLKFGGLTTALFRRADFFTKEFNNYVTVLTFKYSPNIDYVKESLTERGYINDKVILNNIYEYYSQSPLNNRLNHPLSLFTNVENKENGEYQSTEFDTILMKSGLENNFYIKIECYNQGVLERIYELNENNNLKRIRNFKDGNLVEELFYRNDGTLYLRKTFEGTAKSKIKEIFLIGNNEEVIKRFKNHKEFQTNWMNELMDNQKENFLIVDGRPLDSFVLNYKAKKVLKLFVIHSTHLRDPFETYSTLRMGNRALLNTDHIDRADGIIFLTNAQKDDVKKRFGDRSTYKVIPHYLEYEEKKKVIPKEENQFVVISRFHEEKQLDHIIKAFSIVRDAGFEFKLNLFGDGGTKHQLETLIEDLNLHEQVLLKGFTANPLQEFEVSEGSFLTSKYEGFGLTILESLISGCPVFAYDIKYGPSDMIENGYNGYLVEKNNINELAERLITYIKLSSEEKQTLINHARESAEKFNREAHAQQWKEALDGALLNFEYRRKAEKRNNIQYNLSNISFNRKEMKVQIALKSVTEAYTTLINDLDFIEIGVDKLKIKMDLNQELSQNGELVYECVFPFELLKKNIEVSGKCYIYCYIKLDGVIHTERLKTINGVMRNRENIQSYSKNIYQLKGKPNHGIEIKRQKLDGLKGIFRYIKYM